MPGRRRRTALPDGVQRALELPRGERVLASAVLARAGWAVATTHGLIVVRDGGPGQEFTVDRRGWELSGAAAWADNAQMLQVTWVGTSRATLLEFGPAGAGFLPEVIRERVEASVVVSQRIPVDGRRGVTVAIRRAGPGAPLVSQVVPDRGLKLEDPIIVARIEAELAELRDAVGLR